VTDTLETSQSEFVTQKQALARSLAPRALHAILSQSFAHEGFQTQSKHAGIFIPINPADVDSVSVDPIGADHTERALAQSHGNISDCLYRNVEQFDRFNS